MIRKTREKGFKARLVVGPHGGNRATEDGPASAPLISRAARRYATILRFSRTSTTVDLEFEDVSFAGPMHWTPHLKLQPPGGGQFIVDQASGVVITRPLLPGDRIRATELLALVKSTKGLDRTREWVNIDLKCPMIAVVAAKK